MAKVEVKTKDNPKLQQSTLSDGRISLYLEYYLGRTQWIDEGTGKTKVKHQRKKETLNLYLFAKPKTPKEREQNTQILSLANSIRFEKEQQLKADRTGKRIIAGQKKINLYDFFDTYLSEYTKGDVRIIKNALNHFRLFMKNKHPMYSDTLRAEQLTKEIVQGYVSYLVGYCKGDGAVSYYKRFKKVIINAVDKDIIYKNPCNGVKCKSDEQALKKDILSIDEIQQLISTKYQSQNAEVRRAFIFSLYTGIRYCDIKELRYCDVDPTNKILKFEQVKTKGHSNNCTVITPLNESLLTLIGTPDETQSKEDLIFNLPSHTMCLKALRRWTARSGIDKHITWHCARHSFVVNILNNGANIKTVASLLGHSGLKHTEKYTRAVDSLKEAAINSLPTFEI